MNSVPLTTTNRRTFVSRLARNAVRPLAQITLSTGLGRLRGRHSCPSRKGSFDRRPKMLAMPTIDRPGQTAELAELEEAKALIGAPRLKGAGGTPGGVGTFFSRLILTVIGG